MAYLFLFSKTTSDIESNEKFGFQKDLESSSPHIKEVCEKKDIEIWMKITSDATPTLTENMWRRRILYIEDTSFDKSFERLNCLLTTIKNSGIDKIKCMENNNFEFFGNIFHCDCKIKILIDLLTNVKII
jgi:hypothetical protein